MAEQVPASSGGQMGSGRFKLIMRYKQLAKELEKLEVDMLKAAKNLALTSDCLNEAREREEFFIRETEALERKTAKAK